MAGRQAEELRSGKACFQVSDKAAGNPDVSSAFSLCWHRHRYIPGYVGFFTITALCEPESPLRAHQEVTQFPKERVEPLGMGNQKKESYTVVGHNENRSPCVRGAHFADFT